MPTPAAVTVVGLMSAGRVPAMINFTAGSANILAACQAADLATIVTSRAFVEKGTLGPLVDELALASYPVTNSPTAGTSGSASERVIVVTASAHGA
jgi:acyl-CoA synthetase (AMP-forming)/AMP-acid ligase II